MNSPSAAPSVQGEKHSLLRFGTIVAALAFYVVQAIAAARALSPTWNEPYHVLAGYGYWVRADYGVNPEHPPLAKLVATIPLLFMHLDAPLIKNDDSKGTANLHGAEFLASPSGEAIIFRARLTAATFGLLLLLLIYEAACRMLGPKAGWVALLIAAFEPNLIAHSSLVTTDIAFSLFYLATVYAFWRAAERPSFSRWVSCGIVLGLALASKHSALALIPVLALLAVVEVAVAARKSNTQSQSPSVTLRTGIADWSVRMIFIVGIAVLVLWGFYGFRFEARPEHLPLWSAYDAYAGLLRSHAASWALIKAGHFKLLPQSYLFGLIDVMIVTHGPRASFLFGHLRPHAVWYYFPAAFVIKSTIGFLALLILGIATVKKWRGEDLRTAAYVLIPPAFFLGAALTAGTNLGVRHVLPIVPFLILAAAAGASAAWSGPKFLRYMVVGLLCLHAASSLRSAPNDLAYSNELFGGTRNTYRNLSDSNADWGQGLNEARNYLAAHNIHDCWFAYIGTVEIAPYRLPCKMLTNPFMASQGEIPPASYHGAVLVGGTELTASYFGGGALNPYEDFWKLKPVANLGGAILVYEGDFDLRRPAAVAHMLKAWKLYAQKNQERAIQEALTAADLAPDHPAPPYIVGYILAQQKRTEPARAQFLESLRLARSGDPAFMGTWIKSNETQLKLLAR